MIVPHTLPNTAGRAIALVLAIALLATSTPLQTASAAGDVISLRVITPHFDLTARQLQVPEYATDATPGAPQLPVYATLVTLPGTGDWELSYESIDSRILTQTVTLPAALVPALELAPPSSAAAAMAMPTFLPVIDQPDPAIYDVDAFYPDAIVQTGEAAPQGDHRILPVRVFPFQVNPITGEVRYHPDVRITIHVHPGAASRPQPRAVASQPAPTAAHAGNAVRIHTLERGMHRLTYDELSGASVPVGPGGADPRTFALTTDGEPVAIKIQGGADGQFNPGDLVIFYATPYTLRWQKHNVYWLTYGGAPSPAMAQRNVTPTGGEPVVDTLTQTQRVEANRQYLGRVARAMDADHWFDNYLVIDVASNKLTAVVTYTLDLDDPVATGNATIRVLAAGGRDVSGNTRQHALAITLNGQRVGDYVWQGESFEEHVLEAVVPAAWLRSSANTITLEASHALAPAADWYMVAPDWVEIAYTARADAEGDRMLIAAMAAGASQGRVTGFSTDKIAVYDVRDPRRPVELLAKQAIQSGSAYTLNFWDANLPNPAYALTSDAALLAPALVQVDTPSSWRTPNHSADYIAITPSAVEHGQLATAIAAAVQPLLDHRAAEGLRVAQVSVQDIYDEFSYGKRTPVAIQDFVRYAYQNWNRQANGDAPPQYVLLVGDGHYDFTGNTTPASPNLIPPYLPASDYWYGEVPADNRFVSLDGPDDFLPELAIGRIPTNDAAGVTRVVDKILNYENPGFTLAGSWQRRAVFVAGRCNDSAGNFHALSNQNRAGLPADYTDSTVYTGDVALCPEADVASQTTAATAAVQEEFNQGALYLQYVGHGAERAWIDPVYYGQYTNNLQANTRLPFVTHNSCSTGYFIHPGPNAQAVAEDMVARHADRGAIANWSGSGLYTAWAGMTRSQGLMKAMLHDRIDRLGLAVNAARYTYYAVTTRERQIVDSTVLFGDPALKLRLPAAGGSEAFGSIGGKVWHDSNGNGVQDEAAASELNGVAVTLTTTAGALVARTTTANDPSGRPGRYTFGEVTPGSYGLRFSTLSGYAFSPQDQGGNDSADSDANPASGQTAVVTVAADQTLSGWDAGLYQPVTVGGSAWVDANDDHRYDPEIEWLLDGLIIRVSDERGQAVGAATVGPDGGFAAGKYQVGGLPPGVYTVEVADLPSRYLPIDPTRQASAWLASGQRDLTLDFRFVATTTVTIATLTAQQRGAVVTLSWQTLAEEGITGFHVLRAAAVGGPYQRMTMTPLPSLAVGGGASYRWEDRTALPGQAYWYKLSTVPDGAQIGPVAAERISAHVFLPAVERGR